MRGTLFARKRYLWYVATDQVLWIALRNPLIWLYSTHAEEEVTVQCAGGAKHVSAIKRTRQITLSESCKLLTREMCIKTKGVAISTNVKTYLSEYDLSVPNVAFTHETNFTSVKFKNVINGDELTQIGTKISDIIKTTYNARPRREVHLHVICTLSVVR